MNYKAVVFDFNGTLFWDTPYNNQAWDQFFKKHGVELTDDEKMQKIHGKPNKDILKSVFGREFHEAEYHTMSEEKETIYRTICKNSKLEYAPGAIEFINFLKTNAIDYAIATSSGKGNINFYLENMGLGKHIDPKHIIFDDGTLKGKPNPDIFLKAIKRIGHEAEDVVIFEDSMAGIKAAEKANAGKIIIVNSNGDDYSHLPYQKIRNFNQVDRDIFKEII